VVVVEAGEQNSFDDDLEALDFELRLAYWDY
jgi:hypothetical protein